MINTHLRTSHSYRSKKTKDKTIIFDFDGVLADSFEMFYLLISQSMYIAGFTISRTQYRNLFLGNIHKEFRKFLKTEEKYKLFTDFRSSNYARYYARTKLFDEVVNFLQQIKENYFIAIASSGKRDAIVKLLQKNRIKHYFDLICATDKMTKENMLMDIISKSGNNSRETIMVTDTVGDLIVAKKMGIKTVAVTWGFHSAETLKSAKPDYIARNFKILHKQLEIL